MGLKTTRDQLKFYLSELPPKEERTAEDAVQARILHDAMLAHDTKEGLIRSVDRAITYAQEGTEYDWFRWISKHIDRLR